MTEESDKIAMFMEVSGLGYDVAKQTLTIHNYNLEQAINFHLERVANGDFVSCDDEPSQNGTNAESSASMASTSTETAYHPIDNEDDVRAPIPPKREQIILPEEDNFRIRKKHAQAPRSVCPLRNFEHEGRLQEAQIEAAVFSEFNGFESSNDSNGLFGVSSTASSTSDNENRIVFPTVRKLNNIASTTTTTTITAAATIQGTPSRLSELFRPPVEISFCGSFQAARDYAKDQNRWLIVNVQDNKDFSCQVLNRDIWSNERLREILKEYFVFWQIAIDNTDGHRYQVFYDIKIFPYIGIIDPRTGEEKCSHKNGFRLTIDEFLQELQEYLRANTAHPNMEQAIAENNVIDNIEFLINKLKTSKHDEPINSPQKMKRRKLDLEPSSLSEQEQIELAMRNSLREIESNGNLKNSYTDDDDDDEEDDDGDVDEFDDDFTEDERSNLEAAKEAQLKINDTNADVECAKVPDETKETYTTFLGDDNDPKVRIQLRLPNGDREIIEWPSTTKIKALKLYIPFKYPKITSDGPYKVICPFTIGNAGNNVLDLDDTHTLQEAKLFPTVILHLRNDDY